MLKEKSATSPALEMPDVESKENLDLDSNSSNASSTTVQPTQKVESAALKKKPSTNTKRGAKRL
jgi:hypothetical protein